MYPLPQLTRAQEKSFNQALTDSRRKLRFKARLFDKHNRPLPIQLLLLDGEVVVDDSGSDQVTRSAHITIVDPYHHLNVDARTGPRGAAWFSKQLGLWWGIWVRDLERWVDIPVFRGPIFEVSKHGVEIDIDAQGKEAGHLPPAVFPRSFSVRKGTKYSAAIRAIMETRGESRFQLDRTSRGLNRDKTWGLGQSPWKAVQNLAKTLDRQLYFRGDGTLRLRELPSHPAWRFTEGKDALILDDAEERISRANVYNLVVVRGETKPQKTDVKKKTSLASANTAGATSIVVNSADKFVAGRRVEIGRGDKKEIRTVDGTYTSGTTIPLSSALDLGHPKGAPVSVRYRTERTKRIVGRAQLNQHPLSAENLSDGKRPLVWLEDRPRIHKKKKLEEKAGNILDRKKRGLEDEISLSVVPVPHLEEGDRVMVEVNGHNRSFRLRRFSIPLNVSGSMEINWLGDLSPEQANRGGFLDISTTDEVITNDTTRTTETLDEAPGETGPGKPGKGKGPKKPGKPEKKKPGKKRPGKKGPNKDKKPKTSPKKDKPKPGNKQPGKKQPTKKTPRKKSPKKNNRGKRGKGGKGRGR